MIAPATTSSCGPELATMPGTHGSKKLRISPSNVTRSGVAMRSPPAQDEDQQLQEAGDADGRRKRPAAKPASLRSRKSAIITAISAMLNKAARRPSGRNIPARSTAPSSR